MAESLDKNNIKKLVGEAVYQLCRVSIGSHDDFTIDGIICIEAEGVEIVVKIHEKSSGESAPKARHSTANSSSVAITEGAMNVGQQMVVNVARSELIPVEPPKHASSAVLFKQPSASSSFGQTYVTSSLLPVQLQQFPVVTSGMSGDVSSILLPAGTEDDDLQILGVTLNQPSEYDMSDLNDMNYLHEASTPNRYTPSHVARIHAAGMLPNDSSDDELKIEKLKAGRVRRPCRDINHTVDEPPSTEEFRRTLKSEKLKRSRDRSPEFPTQAKLLKQSLSSSSLASHGDRQSDSPTVISIQGLALDGHIANTVVYSSRPGVESTVSTVMTPLASRAASNTQPTVASFEPNRMSFASKVSASELMQEFQGVSDAQQSSPRHHYHHPGLPSSSKVMTTSQTPDQHLIPNSSLSLLDDDPYPWMEDPDGQLEKGDDDDVIIFDFDNFFNESLGLSSLDASSAGVLSEEGKLSNAEMMRAKPCLQQTYLLNKDTSYKCPYCKEEIVGFHKLDYHLYKNHPGNFLCPVCMKAFRQRSTRNRHIVAVHSVEKNFGCRLCPATFTRADGLRKHHSRRHAHVSIPHQDYSYAKGEVLLDDRVKTIPSQDKQQQKVSSSAIQNEAASVAAIQAVHGGHVSRQTVHPELQDLPISAPIITNIVPIDSNMAGYSGITWPHVQSQAIPRISSVLTQQELGAIASNGSFLDSQVVSEPQGTHASLAPETLGTHASLVPETLVTHTSLTPEPQGTHASLAPAPQGTHASLSPETLSTNTILAPQPQGTHASLALEPQGTHASLAPVATHRSVRQPAEEATLPNINEISFKDQDKENSENDSVNQSFSDSPEPAQPSDSPVKPSDSPVKPSDSSVKPSDSPALVVTGSGGNSTQDQLSDPTSCGPTSSADVPFHGPAPQPQSISQASQPLPVSSAIKNLVNSAGLSTNRTPAIEISDEDSMENK